MLFLQGGASLQFAMVPANLRPAGASADYVLTGHWSKAALKEAQKAGRARACRLDRGERLRPRPGPGRARPRPRGRLPPLHLEQHDLRHAVVDRARAAGRRAARLRRLVRHPEPADRRRPLRARLRRGPEEPRARRGDAWSWCGSDLLERTPGGLPALLDYRLMAESRSLYNTPPTFAIYVVGLVLEWLRELGGLAEVGEAQRGEGGAALRRDRRERRLLPRPRPAGEPLADERDLPPARARSSRRRS